jgi:hypothetical protein
MPWCPVRRSLGKCQRQIQPNAFPVTLVSFSRKTEWPFTRAVTSHGRGMAARGRLEIGVEGRRHDPGKGPVGRRDVKVTAGEADQAVACQFLQWPLALVKRPPVDAVAGACIIEIAFEEAHQFLDYVASQQIIAGQVAAPLGGKPASFYFPPPPADVGGVLHVAQRQPADGGSADTDQDIGGIAGVALEVAPQGAARGSNRQIVMGQREMIEADGFVSGASKQLAGQFGLLQALGRTWKRGGVTSGRP